MTATRVMATATAMVTTWATIWAMAMGMRLVGNKKAREGCKGNDDGNVRVAGDKKGKG